MKNSIKFVGLLFGALMINNLACKKSGNNTPPVNDFAMKVLATNMASKAYYLLKSLGYTIFHPANPPVYPGKPTGYSSFIGPKPDSAGNCGFNLDTAMAYSDTLWYEIDSINGASHFNTICNGAVVSGYKVRDTLTFIFPRPRVGTAHNGENFTITLVTPGNITSLIIDGSSNINNSRSPDIPGGPTISETGSFIYSAVKANLTEWNYDLASGSVTFTDSGGDDSGKWNCSGTILFLGNHNAKVTINGITYTVYIST